MVCLNHYFSVCVCIRSSSGSSLFFVPICFVPKSFLIFPAMNKVEVGVGGVLHFLTGRKSRLFIARILGIYTEVYVGGVPKKLSRFKVLTSIRYISNNSR